MRTSPMRGPTSSRMLEALTPVWVDLPQGQPFQGFPVFPQGLTGYGAYPRPGTLPDLSHLREMQLAIKERRVALQPTVQPLAPAEPEPPGWPRWVRLKDKEPLPYAENLALLVRHGDRVWWRGVDEDAFVPLYFHDKFATLGVGAQVEVRQAGEFELLLHNSTRIVSQGPVALRLAAMDQNTVNVELHSLTRVRLRVSQRDNTFVLPDGSKIRITPPAATAEEMGPALLILLRADEPGWLGGRASIFNAGQRPVLYESALGESTLEPGHRVTFFLQPPPHPIPASVVAEGITLEADGRALRGTAAAEAHVSWCGARFALEASTPVRLDPLQGQPFAAPTGTASMTPQKKQ
ncbi:MAG TPA: hypothetical protein VFD82_19610 [Planctomycetota bacterium]|nr:hypothetical protein [Planctomycetota bacterium]